MKTETFPDRRDRLFGRMANIHHLTDRARQPGLTAIAARPLMGKTWTLTEVARLLLEEDRFLVGYHESKGQSGHLLYAVSDLYARWLGEASMRNQAISLWERNKDNVIPRIGQMVGVLLEKLVGKQLPIAGALRAAFDWLAEAQKDLGDGGLQLAPLHYDQALSVTELIAKISQRRIVLILDAWEKSPSLGSEFTALETLLKHREDWPHTHIVLAVRNPELDSTQVSDEGYRRACDLCRISSAAQLHELAPINQQDPKERDRIIRFIRNTVPAARHVPDQRILDMIDGYPGVLDFWTNEANRTTIQSLEDLQRIASDAQALRYLELEYLLAGLQDQPSLAVAARLAFFPRLDSATWETFRDLLLEGQNETAVDALIDAKVLKDECFPTYGHDTRHAAARQWFVKHRPRLIRSEAEKLIEAIASRVEGVDKSDHPFITGLAGCFEAAHQVKANPKIFCLTNAARATLAGFDAEDVLRHDFDAVYRDAIQRNTSFSPLIASSLLRRGFVRMEKGDYGGAIADQTAAIALPNVPAAQIARALTGRGFAKGEEGDFEGAITDYTAIIALHNVPVEQMGDAFVLRGLTKDKLDGPDDGIADLTAAIELADAPIDGVAGALFARGLAKSERDPDGAISDFTAVVTLPNASVDDVSLALVHRGIVKGEKKDYAGAITDYTSAVALHNVNADTAAHALLYRGEVKSLQGDVEGRSATTLPLLHCLMRRPCG